MNKYEIESLVEKVVRAKDRLVRAEIDASNCQTKRDWDAFHNAENKFFDIRDEVVNALYEPHKNAR